MIIPTHFTVGVSALFVTRNLYYKEILALMNVRKDMSRKVIIARIMKLPVVNVPMIG